MKKLVIMALAIAMAVVSNAASVKWMCPYGIANGSEEGVTSASVVYLIDSSVLSQNDIYSALIGGQTLDETVSGLSTKSVALDEGGFSTQTFTTEWAAASTKDLYMVCFDSDLNAVYFSEEMSKTVLGVGDTKYQFGADSSMNGVMADMSTFDTSAGGWVSTAAVPEPTSGLLLLLGMAGLALKRKQA